MFEFLGKILLAAAIGGGALIWFGVKEYRLTRLARAEPQALTCRALQDGGPGDNAHVRLTDFVLLVDAFAVKSTNGSPLWENAWIPAVPVDGAFAKEWMDTPDGKRLPPPKDLRVLVQWGHGSELQFSYKPLPTVIQGTVINEIDALDDDVAKILADSYPGLDTGRCWILEKDRVPNSSGVGYAMIGGGLLLILGAATGGLYAHRASQRKAEDERRFEERRARARAERVRGAADDYGDVPKF
jgi:hypothetical protein